MGAVFAETAADPACLEALARLCEEVPVVGVRRDLPAALAEQVEATWHSLGPGGEAPGEPA